MSVDKTYTVELQPYWTMHRDNTRNEKGELKYGDKYPEGKSEEIVFEHGEALVVLLANQVVFPNNYWWRTRDGWSKEQCDLISINVNCNDVFQWGSADAEQCKFSELQEVFENWVKDPVWGTAVWVMKVRKMMPQKPVYDRIQSAGNLGPRYYGTRTQSNLE